MSNFAARRHFAERWVGYLKGRLGFLSLTLIYALLVAACLISLASEDELSLGRNPLANLAKTAGEFARPSFLDLWFGDPHLEYKSDDGRVLRVENRQEVEADYLAALGRATWTTVRIATLGSLLGALLALPLAVLTARNLSAPKPLAWLAKAVLDITRSIHTLVFGLVLVGIVGLGPTAGILAIGLHSLGTYGKLFAEAIESLDMAAIDAVRSVGATPDQVFFNAVWPSVLPQFVASHLYVWEFNIRDSTILGLIGAGGLGLLITEATALFQWGRLSTVLIVVVLMVSTFDALSRRIRQALA
ncbi:MAG: phosphonate ABC transporter, permease protein PhnE [Rhodocyclaceae bacterium]|nr:phosphonate ABC transporter, permease protein PhnE [Rhodocyclaceae bacterium]